ncbi:Zinc finger C2H2-type domain containing protein [Gracilaria domingensis]|nr:Zinc finger C2H2-type domain containing protein [Gracilaria domingensis]
MSSYSHASSGGAGDGEDNRRRLVRAIDKNLGRKKKSRRNNQRETSSSSSRQEYDLQRYTTEDIERSTDINDLFSDLVQSGLYSSVSPPSGSAPQPESESHSNLFRARPLNQALESPSSRLRADGEGYRSGTSSGQSGWRPRSSTAVISSLSEPDPIEDLFYPSSGSGGQGRRSCASSRQAGDDRNAVRTIGEEESGRQGGPAADALEQQALRAAEAFADLSSFAPSPRASVPVAGSSDFGTAAAGPSSSDSVALVAGLSSSGFRDALPSGPAGRGQPSRTRCRICDRWVHDLNEHRRTCRLHCSVPGCGYSHYFLSRLKRHEKFHKPKETHEWECWACGRCFVLKAGLTRHMKGCTKIVTPGNEEAHPHAGHPPSGGQASASGLQASSSGLRASASGSHASASGLQASAKEQPAKVAAKAWLIWPSTYGCANHTTAALSRAVVIRISICRKSGSTTKSMSREDD